MAERCEARFFVKTVSATAGQQGGSIELQVACKGDKNRSWSQATPSGQITMYVNNPEGYAFFKDLLGGPDLSVMFTPLPIEDNNPKEHFFRPSEQEPGQAWPPASACGECGFLEAQHTA